jgi:DNA-directed RNA polymerase subunit M/transcription elongation factor TFIIS
MITYLKSQEYYEELYDTHTAKQCRECEEYVNDVFSAVENKIAATDFEEHRPGWYLQYSTFYLSFVEMAAVLRYHERSKAVLQWMQDDKEKDQRIAHAQLANIPPCPSCGHGLVIFNKYYLRRDGWTANNGQDIMLMYECKSCHKRSSYWHDGTVWDGPLTYCDKCGASMVMTAEETKTSATFTYTCTNCSHSYSEKMDFSKRAKKDELDRMLEEDRKRFCLDDQTLLKIKDRLYHMGRLGQLHADASEKTENSDVYDAVKDIKQLKVAQVIEQLRLATEKMNYIEFKFGDPQLGREVIIDFNCLDASPDRDEAHSKKELQKAIKNCLADTNWRLMSDGVSYRLGYLTGQLKAYEGEEELKKLVDKKTESKRSPDSDLFDAIMPKLITYDLDKLDKPKLLQTLLEGQHAFSALEPLAEDPDGPNEWFIIHGKIDPDLRVLIQFRKNDKTLPKFVRGYDFEIRHKSVMKKSRSRKKAPQ